MNNLVTDLIGKLVTIQSLVVDKGEWDCSMAAWISGRIRAVSSQPDGAFSVLLQVDTVHRGNMRVGSVVAIAISGKYIVTVEE